MCKWIYCKWVYNENKDMLAIKEICKFGKLNTFCMQENDWQLSATNQDAEHSALLKRIALKNNDFLCDSLSCRVLKSWINVLFLESIHSKLLCLVCQRLNGVYRFSRRTWRQPRSSRLWIKVRLNMEWPSSVTWLVRVCFQILMIRPRFCL